MNIKDYIFKLQQRPVRERKRIAVIATVISFSIILLIWVMTFKEINKTKETETDPAAASINDLKKDFQTGKNSIQDMMQDLPSQTGATGVDGDIEDNLLIPGEESQNLGDNLDNGTNNQDSQDKPSMPQLP
jgi:hypothetical protein